MDLEEIVKAKQEATQALRQADRSVWYLGVVAQELFEDLARIMAEGEPSVERQSKIRETYAAFHAKIHAYENAMKKVGTQVKEFCQTRKEPIDPEYLILLKSIMDTCDSVIDKTSKATTDDQEASSAGELP